MSLSRIFKGVIHGVIALAAALVMLLAGAPPAAVQAAPYSTTPWMTYLGGDRVDQAHGVVTDAAGNIYITGFSYNSWHDVAAPVVSHSETYCNYPDAFIAKLNANGALVWHTFYGSFDNTQNSAAIALDGAGKVYITGEYFIDNNQMSHAYVARFDGGTGEFDWKTDISDWHGGTPEAIKVSGNYVYVAGLAHNDFWRPEYPPDQGPFGGGDAFVVALTTDGDIAGCNALGGTAYDIANDIAVDGIGNVYITGYSHGAWDATAFGAGLNAYQAESGFLAKLEPVPDDGTDWNVLWHTFIGSSGNYGEGIALNSDGNVYITGTSYEDWGGEGITVTPRHGNNSDAYVAKYDNNGEPVWNTFIGSDDPDEGARITIKPDSSIFVAGSSYSTWGDPIRPLTERDCTFVAGLDNSGNVVWNTFFVCPTPQAIQARDGNIYLAGHELFPWGTPIHQHWGSGNSDALVIKMGSDGNFDPPANLTSLTENLAADFVPAFDGGTYEYTLAAANAETSVTFTATLEGATIKYSYGSVLNKTVASGTGEEVPLNEGENVITINVSKAGLANKAYTITVNRNGPANLTSLTENLAAAFNPAFSGGTYTYTLAAANTEESVTFNAALADASITYSYGETTDEEVASGTNKSILLEVGGNTIIIKANKAGYAQAVYTITVNRAAPPSSAAEILTYSIPQQTGSAIINSGATTITVEVAYGTALNALVASFTASPGITSIKVGEADQISGSTANDFTNPVTYRVTAEDGSTFKDWVVTVNAAPASTIATVTSAAYTVSAEGTEAETITNVPYNTAKAAFLANLAKGQPDQVWNTDNITDPVVTGNALVVTAQDGTTIVTYTITVIPPSDDTSVTSAAYTINAGNGTITNVPSGTTKATFLAGISKGQVNQIWNTDNITNPVVTGNTLIVTAQDGTTSVTYTVTVNAAPNNSGGGGGGGGFVLQPEITPEPEPPNGTTNISGAVNDEGVFTEVVSIVAEDQTAVIDIPAGTVGLDADLQPLTEITMIPLAEPPAQPPAGTVAFMYDLGPDGATFDPAITLSMPLPEGADPATATIAYWDGNEWITLETTYDPVTGRLTALTSHFTVFATIVLEKEPEPAAIEPNPEPVKTTPFIAETPETPTPTKTSPKIQPSETAPNISENPAASEESKRSFAWYWWLIISIGAAVILTTGWIEWRRGAISRRISGK